MYSKLTPVSRARPDAVDAAKNTMAVNRLPFSLNRPLSCCCWSCRHCLPTNNYPTCHCIAERPDQLAVSSEGYLVAISRYLDDFSMFFLGDFFDRLDFRKFSRAFRCPAEFKISFKLELPISCEPSSLDSKLEVPMFQLEVPIERIVFKVRPV